MGASESMPRINRRERAIVQERICYWNVFNTFCII